MRRAGRLAVAALAACAAGAQEAGAQLWLGPWNVSATNNARIERYDASGNRAFSPYSELGSTGYDEWTVQGEARPSAHSQAKFFASGVVNDSVYRSSDRGFVPERLLLSAESGESALAWRAQAGDYFAFTTLRTMQRQLKGASVELQPAGPLRQSLLLFGGTQQFSWRHLQWSDDSTFGASWLVDGGRYGKWNANVLRNERGASGPFRPTDERQTVASLAGEQQVKLGAWTLSAEGEAAQVRGESQPDDHALFAQLTLADAGSKYQVKGERYGRDYRVFGAITPADRRSFEGWATWNLPRGLTLTTRLQDFRDQYEGPNPQRTRVAGVNLAGSYVPWSVSGSLDAFVQEIDNRDATVDARSRQVTAYLSRPFGRVVGSFSGNWQDDRDALNAQLSRRSWYAQVGAMLPVAGAGLKGTVTPGVMVRETRGSNGTREWQPTLNLGLEYGRHRLSFNVSRLAQDPRNAAFAEVATINGTLDYRFVTPQHEVGFDVVSFDRRPKPGESTEAYRVGVFWIWKFERRPALAARIGAAPALLSMPVGALAFTPMLLTRIAPGQELVQVESALQASGAGAALREPGALVYERRLLPDVEQRQRLVVVHDAGIVDRVALVVALDGGDAPRTYERVRRALLETYGAPTFTFEEGAWGPGYATDLAAARFVRVSEWATPYGVLRLGVPRRLDGVARIEVHHLPRSLSPRDTGWGLIR